MSYVSKQKAVLDKARGEYIANTFSVKEVADQNGLNVKTFRSYLNATNAIKPEHKNQKQLRIKQAKNAIAAVRGTPLPAEIVNMAKSFECDIDSLKGDMIAQANAIVNGIGRAIQMIDPNDLQQTLLFEKYANTLKLLNDAIGLFAKAPTIAQQFNFNQNKVVENKPKDSKLEVELNFVNKD